MRTLEESVDLLGASLVVSAVRLLLRAYRYSIDLGGDAWQCSVSRFELELRGMDACDLRWMLMRGLVEHRCELTPPGRLVRSFGPRGGLHLESRSAFLLTPAGYAALNFHDVAPPMGVPHEGPFAEAQVLAATQPATADIDRTIVAQVPAARDVWQPAWRSARRELYCGKELVKRFRVPAPNQECILAVFEEEGWPDTIDDPLPPERLLDPKRRLQGAIKCLNRNQERRLLNFFGTGRGSEIGWQILADLRVRSGAPDA